MSAEAQDWFHKVGPFAVRASRKFGIPPSIVLAQAALESGYGKHDMGVFNYFGIKGEGPSGKSVTRGTQEFRDGRMVDERAKFRAYDNPKQAFEDHQRLLLTHRAYADARAALPDSVAFVHRLTGVYATDPNYGTKLEQIINKYNLLEWDQQATQDPAPLPGPADIMGKLDQLERRLGQLEAWRRDSGH